MNKEITDRAFDMMANDSALLSRASAALRIIQEQIENRAIKQKPLPKNFEVWHEKQVAREALLTAIVEGKTMDDAMFIALDRVKIGYVRNEAGRFLRWAA